MGIGFLIILFTLIPLTIILLSAWFGTKNSWYSRIIGVIWIPIFILIIGSSIYHFFTEKKRLERSDIYGEYIVDRKIFSGKQSNWQYEHFRFEITKENKFLFHVTEQDKTVKTYIGRVSFLDAYKQPRIVLHVDTPRHHIIEDMPTLYREPFSFYYVFKSKHFGNVFFKKGKWKPINK